MTWADEKALLILNGMQRRKVKQKFTGYEYVAYDFLYSPPFHGNDDFARFRLRADGSIRKWVQSTQSMLYGWQEINSPRMRAVLLLAAWPDWTSDDTR